MTLREITAAQTEGILYLLAGGLVHPGGGPEEVVAVRGAVVEHERGSVAVGRRRHACGDGRLGRRACLGPLGRARVPAQSSRPIHVGNNTCHLVLKDWKMRNNNTIMLLDALWENQTTRTCMNTCAVSSPVRAGCCEK